MRKRALLVFVLIAALIASSCSISSNLNINKLNAKEAVTFLASDAMEGRLAGTSGNLHAQRAIEAAYKRLGLEKFSGDSYLQEYEQAFYDPYKLKYSMKIITADNKTRVCVWGEDFMYTGGGSISLSTPIVTNMSDIGIGDCAIVLDNKDDAPKVYGKVKATLILREPFMKGSPRGRSSAPSIQISRKLYDLIKSSDKPRLEISFEAPRENIKAANVIGKISGKDSKSAIVLSAHFDHIGFAGDSIFDGAIDNASGTAVLLCLAKQLKQYSEKNKPGCDIIICAFNSEEYGLLGSDYFVGSLKGRYDNLYNINVDCVGLKIDKTLLVTGNRDVSGVLMTDIEKHLSSKGFECKQQGPDDFRSDHISFSDQNYCSVCLGTDNLDLLHTVRDTPDTIDFAYLDKLASAVFDFVVANTEKHYKSPIKLEDLEQRYGTDPKDAAVSKQLDEERKSLEFGEYKLIKIGDRNYYVANFGESFDSFTKFKMVYPFINIPPQIGKYKLSHVNLEYWPDMPNMRLDPDVVYHKDLYMEDIGYINCLYQSSDTYIEINLNIYRDAKQYSDMAKYNENPFDMDSQDFYVDKMPFKLAYNKGTKDVGYIKANRQAGARPVEVGIGLWKTVPDKSVKGRFTYSAGLSNSTEENIQFLKSIEINKFIEDLLANFRG